MPTYKFKDPGSGKTATMTGDSPPSEQEISDFFTAHGQPSAVSPEVQNPQSQPGDSQTASDRTVSGQAPGYIAASIMPGDGINTKGIGDATANSLPLAGMIAGAQASLPFAAAAGPLAPLVPVAGAAMGAMGGKGYQKVYQYLNGQDQTAGQNASDILDAGKGGALSEMGGQIAAPVLGAAAGAVKNSAVRFGKQFAGIPQTIGKYVLGRGTGNVLTTENMSPDAASNALESAQSFLSKLRSTAAQGVKTAEDSIDGSKMFDTTEMAQALRQQMSAKGLTGSTSELASGKGVGILNAAQELLDKGKLSGTELINVKRLLYDAVDYSGGRLPEIGGLAEGLIKGVARGAKEATNGAYPALGQANAEAAQSFGLYDKYRKFFGQSDAGPEVKAGADALRRIRGAFVQNPGVAGEVSGDLGQSVGNNLFDRIAAQHYTANSPVLISPSSPLLKGLSTIGMTGPQVSGAALRAASGAARALQFSKPFMGPAAMAYDQLGRPSNYSIDSQTEK